MSDPESAGSTTKRRGIHRIPRRRLAIDRSIGVGIRVGGATVIALVSAILVFLVVEAWPLQGRGRVEPGFGFATPSTPEAVASDDYRTHVAALGRDGNLSVFRGDGQLVAEQPIASEAPLHRVMRNPERNTFAATTIDGAVVFAPVRWLIRFENNERIVSASLGTPAVVSVDPAGQPLEVATANLRENGASVVAQLADGELLWVRHVVEENDFTGERSESIDRSPLPSGVRLTDLALDPREQYLYGVTVTGELVWWDLSAAVQGPPQVASNGGSAVTAIALLTGGRALVVGGADGSLSVWSPVRRTEFATRLTQIRELTPRGAAIERIVPAHRDRTFAALDANGQVGVYFSTSERLLWQGAAPLGNATAAAIAPKGDALIFAGSDGVQELRFDAPHPEASIAALFRRVWYEGFEKARHIWQSTGGTDEFEAKLGITPLLFGTIKGTVYSLLLAIPLGILGAIYTSQFLHPRYQRVVKPAVEMMASMPTVVLGFVAGLWLAPRMESLFPAFVCMLLLVPVAMVIGGATWEQFPRRFRARLSDGGEVAWQALVVCTALWGSIALGPTLSVWLFDGSFNSWLLETTGARYDQRNAVVVGIAMGFAVIPIIFSIAEDALSSVPRNLAAGSLALGANRWETVIRVVLPTASPGIFSAVMVGLGRAVGETMIVLMATGNTPIMDWSAFNGFRTLAANIAVEIPEAPHGGTLYRTLFLTALLLFALTFAINTAAEVVRQRLRKQYGRL
jgi:phosphate transport system permease protein